MSNYNYVIFTDLDGTLLDKNTFEPGRALDTLALCRKHEVPVVFVTAKTRAEIEVIRRRSGNLSPFISENGGGLFLPSESFARPEGFESVNNYWCLQSTTPIDELRTALKRAARTAGVQVKGFGDMTAEEVAALTGLKTEDAKLAKMREYDEPFLPLDAAMEALAKLVREITALGYRHTHGGILHHITGDFNKGETLSILKKIYLDQRPHLKFIGLGDSYNDLPMLQAVDYPFLIRNPDGSHVEGVHIDGLIITDKAGPEGFAEAVESIIT
jgi:mannosyl-3-phosphoglycerate phosphatase family protein